MAEAMGIALPGNAAIPAVDSRRHRLSELAGRQIVNLVEQDIRPSQIMTQEAFENAIRTMHALGGSTNAVIHLTAIAGRLGIDLPGSLFDELSRTTPFILNLKPSGQYLMEDFFYAGGLAALLKEIQPLLHDDQPTVTGQTLAENIAPAINYNPDVIRSMEEPMDPEGGLAVLTGSLAPTGALIKPTAASESLMTHEGRAIVFEDHDDLFARIDDPDLDVNPDDVLVMRASGPIGAPGMPEWGFLPLPKKILASGVRDMVRLSDARMSGTAFGTVVVHVTPESAAGGPLAAVRNGDRISLNVPQRRLDLLVEDREIQRRLHESPPSAPRPQARLRLHARPARPPGRHRLRLRLPPRRTVYNGNPPVLPYELTVESLIWDPSNVGHIARHNVTLNEVEEVCQSSFISSNSYGGRFLVVGLTQAGRALAVVVEPSVDDRYYVVTARPASRRERRWYREERGVQNG